MKATQILENIALDIDSEYFRIEDDVLYRTLRFGVKPSEITHCRVEFRSGSDRKEWLTYFANGGKIQVTVETVE